MSRFANFARQFCSRSSPDRWFHLAWASIFLALVFGCDQPAPIVTYSVPTDVPNELRPGKDRMLAAMIPKNDDVWFLKVTGPEKAVETIEPIFQNFVQNLTFVDGSPQLGDLPKGWRRGGEKPMRYATLDVETPMKQLRISVSKLQRQENWDDQVAMNVNRWRGQLGLANSDQKWAQGEPLKVAAADGEAVWVDLVGKADVSSPMSAPFANGRPSPASPGTQSDSSNAPTKNVAAKKDDRIKFDRPEGWRDGRMSSMRMAAFNIGPEESPAELTVIPAGGDLRGNVARWLGQVRDGAVPDEVVDKAMAEARAVSVDGREGQRFFLSGDDPDEGTAIDATIVPMDGGMSLFVKMTGPVATVKKESEAIATFLESLKLNL